ncbi:MAG: hypothetical protein WCD53_08065, partial [Microcoleus sp.]
FFKWLDTLIIVVCRVRRCEILDITCCISGGDAPDTGVQIVCTAYIWNMLYSNRRKIIEQQKCQYQSHTIL